MFLKNVRARASLRDSRRGDSGEEASRLDSDAAAFSCVYRGSDPTVRRRASCDFTAGFSPQSPTS